MRTVRTLTEAWSKTPREISTAPPTTAVHTTAEQCSRSNLDTQEGLGVLLLLRLTENLPLRCSRVPSSPRKSQCRELRHRSSSETVATTSSTAGMAPKIIPDMFA